MNVHAIVDYSYLYYKYKFRLDGGKIRRLICLLDSNGNVITDQDFVDAYFRIKYEGVGTEAYGIGAFEKKLTDEYINITEKDISQIYYTIKEIEGFRRKLESCGHNVTLSVCFDMPSIRQEEETEAANDYKANRVKRLGESDFSTITEIRKILTEVGYNTYVRLGTESDDLIANLITYYKDNFDYNIIYTPDADLLAHIGDKVGVMRYKVTKGYQSVDRNNFEEYLSAELKCNMPYNGIMLYKATVGDKSDNIKGINKFGPKAFDKVVEHLDGLGVDWEQLGDYRKTEEVIEMLDGYLNAEQMEQARDCLALVRPMVIEKEEIEEPVIKDLNKEVYMRYNMRSLL